MGYTNRSGPYRFSYLLKDRIVFKVLLGRLPLHQQAPRPIRAPKEIVGGKYGNAVGGYLFASVLVLAHWGPPSIKRLSLQLSRRNNHPSCQVGKRGSLLLLRTRALSANLARPVLQSPEGFLLPGGLAEGPAPLRELPIFRLGFFVGVGLADTAVAA